MINPSLLLLRTQSSSKAKSTCCHRSQITLLLRNISKLNLRQQDRDLNKHSMISWPYRDNMKTPMPIYKRFSKSLSALKRKRTLLILWVLKLLRKRTKSTDKDSKPRMSLNQMRGMRLRDYSNRSTKRSKDSENYRNNTIEQN